MIVLDANIEKLKETPAIYALKDHIMRDMNWTIEELTSHLEEMMVFNAWDDESLGEEMCRIEYFGSFSPSLHKYIDYKKIGQNTLADYKTWSIPNANVLIIYFD